MALFSADAGNGDWVARRELIERAADAEKALRRQVAMSWGPAVSAWYLRGLGEPLAAQAGLSATLSQASDLVFHSTPRVANEMIARRELTSQGAKARRMLLDAFLANPARERFGIQGYGPERAIYEAVYGPRAFTQADKQTGHWVITKPRIRNWRRAWSEPRSRLAGCDGSAYQPCRDH